MVPDGWEEPRLQEICSKPIVYGIVQAGEHIDDGVPYLKSSDIGSAIQVANLQRTHPDIHKKFRRSTVRPGEIVFSLRGNICECSIVPDTLKEANLTQGTSRIVVNEDCNAGFVYYQLRSYENRKRVNAVAKGSTFREISLEDLRKLKICVPPLPEQKKIAEILSTWDRAIEVTEKLLENATRQKRALMQQLLTGKRRFPEFEGNEWQEVNLGDLAEIKRGASPRPIKDERWFSNLGRGWVRISDVTASSSHKLMSTKQILSSEGVEKSVPVDPGELIMSICATIGVPKIVGIPVCIHDGFVVFRKTNLNKRFLYFFLQMISERLRTSGQPGTQKNLNTSIVAAIRIPHISKLEQERIAEVLSKSEDEIAMHSAGLETLQSEKNALMQQLLTGKKRVKIDE